MYGRHMSAWSLPAMTPSFSDNIEKLLRGPGGLSIPYLLLPPEVLSKVEGGDAEAIDGLYLNEIVHMRLHYVRFGDPRIVYGYGSGLSRITERVPAGNLYISLYEAFLAELLLARGTDLLIIEAAERHIDLAERHVRSARADPHVRARILSKTLLLRSVALKARGRTDEAGSVLRAVSSEPWWRRNADPGDIVAIARQRVMMSQSLSAHLELLRHAREYENARPLEYFRTLKRVFEFVVNSKLDSATTALLPHLLDAYSRISSVAPPLSRVSLLKNLAQAEALLGNDRTALARLTLALEVSQSLGFDSQVRQISMLLQRAKDGDVGGALETFRV